MSESDGTSLSALLNPLTPVRLVVRALDDLHAVASVAREDPNPTVALRDVVDEARRDINELLGLIGRLIEEARAVTAGAGSLNVTATVLDGHAAELIDGGKDLTETAKTLDGTGRRLYDGGAELTETAKTLDGTARELHDGGEELLETARELDRHAAELVGVARIFEGYLPQAMRALGTVEELEESLETVAETVEPLQQTAEKVAKVTKRLSRSPS